MFLALILIVLFFFFKQKTAYEMRISDWSSDVCSSDLERADHNAFDTEPATRPLHNARTIHRSPTNARCPARLPRRPARRLQRQRPRHGARGLGCPPGATDRKIGRASGRERGGQDG